MIVVSNSSPLIALAKIGKLHILRDLFGKITIPKAVWHEVVVKGKGKPGAEEVEKAEWIKVREVEDILSVEVLKGEIEVGEAEAIVLAKELNADLLIMDESIPRVIAESIGLRVVGSLAILYIAKKRGLIDEDFDEIVKELRAKGVRFSDDVINRLKQKWEDKSDFNF
jgi:predicted nucleic acid-binding protein